MKIFCPPADCIVVSAAFTMPPGTTTRSFWKSCSIFIKMQCRVWKSLRSKISNAKGVYPTIFLFSAKCVPLKTVIKRKVMRGVTNVMSSPASLSRTFRYQWERKSFCGLSRTVKNGEPKSGLKMRSLGTSVRIVAKLFSGVRNAAISVRSN